jgi:hypothetical protein
MPPSVRLLGIGFYIATCIVLGTLAGRALDGALDTGKLFTILGLALGLTAALGGGFVQLMEVLRAINVRRSERNRRE